MFSTKNDILYVGIIIALMGVFGAVAKEYFQSTYTLLIGFGLIGYGFILVHKKLNR